MKRGTLPNLLRAAADVAEQIEFLAPSLANSDGIRSASENLLNRALSSGTQVARSALLNSLQKQLRAALDEVEHQRAKLGR